MPRAKAIIASERRRSQHDITAPDAILLIAPTDEVSQDAEPILRSCLTDVTAIALSAVVVNIELDGLSILTTETLDLHMADLVLDTNIFLQYRHLNELPWRTLVDGGAIALWIPLTVQRELDKHKADGNSRRANRARSALPLLRALVAADESGIPIEGRDVVVKLLPFGRLIPESYPDLDLSEPDQKIVAEILRASELGVLNAPILVTADTFLAHAARQSGISYVEPLDEWRLPPEPDARGKEIQELRNQVQRLQRNRPEIAAHILDVEGTAITGRIECERHHYEPLEPGQTEYLLERAQTVFPLKLVDDSQFRDPRVLRAVGALWKEPSEREKSDYADKHYPEWLATLREQLDSLHLRLEGAKNIFSFRLVVDNIGESPATKTLLKVSVEGEGLSLMMSKTEEKVDRGGAVALASPPAPPRHRFMSDAILGRNIGLSNVLNDRIDWGSTLSRQRVRNAFYRLSPDGEGKTIRYECDEFRHQHESVTLHCALVINCERRSSASGGVLKCEVHATNLHEPMTFSLPIVVDHKISRTGEKALKLVDELRPAAEDTSGSVAQNCGDVKGSKWE